MSRIEYAAQGGRLDTRSTLEQGRAWIRDFGPGTLAHARREVERQDARVRQAFENERRARVRELDLQDARVRQLFERDRQSRLREIERQDARLELILRRDEADVRRCAFHEAGHAAVAWALGVGILQVWILRDGDGKAHEKVFGRCHLDAVHPVVTAAGVEAEALLGPVPADVRATHERKVVREARDDYTPDDCWSEARARVSTMRPAISALAARLLLEGAVPGDQAARTISAAMRVGRDAAA